MPQVSKKPEYALYLSHAPNKRDQDGKGSTLQVSIVQIRAVDEYRNPQSESEFDDLLFTARIAGFNSEPYSCYGWDVDYRNVFSVDAERAKKMVKTFKKLSRAYEKRAVHPQSFGQFVALYAAGLGIKKLVQCTKSSGWSFDDGQYQVYELKSAGSVIDQAVAAELEFLNPTKSEVA
jgi:hypothetical protein